MRAVGIDATLHRGADRAIRNNGFPANRLTATPYSGDNRHVTVSRNATDRLWLEEGESVHGLIAEVAPILHASHTYSFSVPAKWARELSVGQRVRVPLGRGGRLVVGFVVSLSNGPWDGTLRPIDSLVDSAAFLTPELVELGRQIAAHYCCRLGLTLKAMTPEAVRRERGLKRVRYVRLKCPWPRTLEVRDDGLPTHPQPCSGPEGDSNVGQLPVQSVDPRNTSPDEADDSDAEVRQRVDHSTMETLHPPLVPGIRLTAKRRALLDTLAGLPQPARLDALLKSARASAAVAHTLARAGFIEIFARKEIASQVDSGISLEEPAFQLTEEQSAALRILCRDIDARLFRATLLFGVSGSGKTEVYLRAIRHVLSQGRQVILLVPEIMLTTQLVGRLVSRLPNVAVSHSGLSDAQRSVLWRQVAGREKKVVIGTRSAVFSPCPDLGLICVDEEQEGSYKNLQAPRFHVRDVAIMRGKLLGIPVVLGSATPSLEVWHNSEHHKDYQRIAIRRRVMELPMPRIQVVDMRDEHIEMGSPVLFSRLMLKWLDECLRRKEQALILMNRRGFANRVYCPACKTRLTCPHCSLGMVVHSVNGLSICHYCRHRIPTPAHCPSVNCRHALVQVGSGTQRVEVILRDRFPDARIHRVDSDTMRHRRDYQMILDRFSAGQLDVLVGTQMVAKGLDFPAVSFVGIVDADASGFSADFRAHERLFQLVTQTAGRAGRAMPSSGGANGGGRVVVQTIMPDLPALRFALHHDYESFAAGELPMRRQVGLPPFCRLTRFILSHERDETARKDAEELARGIRSAVESMHRESEDVLGPNACVIPRLRGHYRYDLLLRSPTASRMRQLLHHLVEARLLKKQSATLTIDVDPVSLT